MLQYKGADLLYMPAGMWQNELVKRTIGTRLTASKSKYGPSSAPRIDAGKLVDESEHGPSYISRIDADNLKNESEHRLSSTPRIDASKLEDESEHGSSSTPLIGANKLKEEGEPDPPSTPRIGASKLRGAITNRKSLAKCGYSSAKAGHDENAAPSSTADKPSGTKVSITRQPLAFVSPNKTTASKVRPTRMFTTLANKPYHIFSLITRVYVCCRVILKKSPGAIMFVSPSGRP
jgi:hypothetical protein